MKFRLRQMEVFRAVMLTGSINGAAKLLFTLQPGISRTVAHTEQTLGLKLFERVKGKLVPTAESEALFREVEEFYQHALRVDEFSRNLARGPSGTLSLSTSPCLSKGLMTQVITQFQKKYPKIKIHFHATLLNDMVQEVLSNKVDIAISVLPLEHAHLTATPFMEGKMVCVVPRGHELGQQSKVSMQDMAKYTIVTHDPGVPFGQLVTAAFAKAGVVFESRIDIHQTDVACALVRAGAGIAIVDEFTVEGLGWDDLQVIPMMDEIKLTPSIIRSRFGHGRTYADRFVEMLETQIAQASKGRRTSK